MFYLAEVEDYVRVEPRHFGLATKDAVSEQLQESYVKTMHKDLGFVISVIGVQDVGEGIIIPGDGAAYYKSQFTVLVWKPELHESDKRRFDQVAKYWGAKMVLVNCWEQPYFRISEPPYFKNDKLILKPMSEFSAWGINKETYLNYEGLVHKYLTPTLIPKRK